ncbi:hypothetical protein SISSUDRAFT_918362 [Sistotremastrum suecicum HHB10207 ss-3]|uniref:Novel STAND NTPase 1 domain-containing protein n=1 Tax=Sistotremastrum suecicum HHB10207 ss-3 TaxID=1314776 RepID=A0A166BYH7_9AGAM|nr:hypothetical protein SISSUDRAFT_918362 [Sistotremastrum suecicum HHB10207 ss-3]
MHNDNTCLAPGMTEHFESMIFTLKNIIESLRSRSRKGRFRRSLNIAEDQRSIAELRDDFDRCFSVFKSKLIFSHLKQCQDLTTRAECEEKVLLSELDRSRMEMKQAASKMKPSAKPRANCKPRTLPVKPLPPSPKVFFGRSHFVDQLLAKVCDCVPRHAAILGMGGIGKTSLALHVLHHPETVKFYGRNRFFLSCEPHQDLDMLSSAITAIFGTPCGDVIEEMNIPRLDSRGLLVLDNFETPWEHCDRQRLEDLLSALSGRPNLTLLITMRGSERPNSVAWSRPCLQPLPPLSPEAARQTFVSVSDTAIDDKDLDTLLALVDYIPLAVTLMANLAEYNSCADLLQRWEGEKTSMLTKGYDGRLASVDASIKVTLSSKRLTSSPQALEVLQILSFLPECVTSAHLRDMNIEYLHVPTAVSALLKVTLLHCEGSGRLRVLSPIRQYILRNHPLEVKQLIPLQQYFIKFTKQPELRRLTN